VEPIPGWTATVKTMKVTKPIKTDNGDVTQGVASVTWTGGRIVPGDFQEFKVSVGLPAAASSIEFKALQTYSDGTIVRWIEDTPPGRPEPEHPAPVLTLTSGDATTPATTGTTTATGTGGGSVGPTSGTVLTDVATKSDVNTAKTLSAVGIGVGVLAFVLAFGAFMLGRRPQRR
jgi:periplasmic copper chaperone A